MQLHILLSSIVTYVMLFGSGKLINKIIITFQYFGVEVIVVNWYDDLVCHQEPHRLHNIDIKKSEALFRRVKSKKTNYIAPKIEWLILTYWLKSKWVLIHSWLSQLKPSKLTLSF